MQVAKALRLTLLAGLAATLVSCATAPSPTAQTSAKRINGVRTTAYCHNEGGSGRSNAIGHRLSAAHVMSAASDWSRFPLGTHFRIVGTNEEYVIDDYGGALIGTNTIDLYKPSRLAMRNWGVRKVDIDILQWGSKEESLHVLRPRSKIGIVRRMIARLEARKSS